jgi:hypothetical protein
MYTGYEPLSGELILESIRVMLPVYTVIILLILIGAILLRVSGILPSLTRDEDAEDEWDDEEWDES